MDVVLKPVPVVDLAFPIEGTRLPRDYRFALTREVARCLPWFETEAGAGIHPLKAARTDEGQLLLPRRAKLVLRLPEARVPAACALAGRTLDVDGSVLRVGEAKVRALLAFGTLYAYFVTADTDDEQVFLAGIAAQMELLQTPCKVVCGKRQVWRAGERQFSGYSLMLHDLTLEDSLLLQQVGLGSDRTLGCGILVPHKSVAAVGA